MKHTLFKGLPRAVGALCLSAGLLLALPVPAGAYGGTMTSISAGANHTMAVRADGSLWAWGSNEQGQLGNGKGGVAYDFDGGPGIETRPVKIMDGVASVSAGAYYTMAVKTDGTLWAWGENCCGQLGNGGSGGRPDTFDRGVDRLSPVKIMEDVVSVSAGVSHTVAVKSDGSLWAWGENGDGQLGTGKKGAGSEAERAVFHPAVDENRPVKVMDGVAAAFAGAARTMAIKRDGTLWGWGSGALGDGISSAAGYVRLQPVKIMDGVKEVALGGSHTLAVKTDGTLWGWGTNFLGQMGNGTATDSEYLLPIRIMDRVAHVSSEERYSLAVKTDGSLWTWGDMMWGTAQSDNVINESDCIPLQVLDNVASASAGPTRAAAVKRDGTLWTWGAGRMGELGDGHAAVGDKAHYNMQPTKVMDGAATWGRRPEDSTANRAELPSEWAAEGVGSAVEAGIVPKELQAQYTQAVTRKEFCALAVAVYETAAGAEITGRQKFQDTDDVNVEKLASLGVAAGVGESRFAPSQKLTREQAAVMLDKLAQAMGKPLPEQEASFADRAKISPWAVGAVGRIQGAGVMSGTGSNEFSPAGAYTREQSIVTALQLYELVKE